jgi:biopolymer transport protein TolQ
MLAPSTEVSVPIQLDPLSLVLHASGPVFVVVWSLVLASVLVWLVAVMKALQLARLTASERAFETEAAQAFEAGQLFALARRTPDAPGARVVLALAKRAGSAKVLDSVAKRALVTEQQRATSLLGILSSIGSAGPFIGLFGTVYGIMDAFLRIGQQKSASLPVVAPAIGEALIATAIGLFAAIPAVVLFNILNKRADDMLSGLEAASEGWVALASEEVASSPLPLRTPSGRPQPLPSF